MKLIRLMLETRATWGTCPSCGAKHGEPCRAIESDNDPGVHLERLRQAPETITVRDAA